MTQNDQNEIGIGERAHAKGKRNFILWCFAGLLAMAAFFAALTVAIEPGNTIGTLTPLASILFSAGIVVLIIGMTALWMTKTDELDYQDNVIAGAIAAAFHMVAFPAWFILSMGGLVPEPTAFALYISCVAVALVAYIWMKIRR